MEYDIIYSRNDQAGRKFAGRIEGKRPLFALVLGNTETAKIPGVSAAGRYPEFTDFTPAADAELLYYGKCKSIEGVPVTPEGIPTPALITMAAMEMTGAPMLIVNGGLNVNPKAPFVELGGESGGDIRKGDAVKNAENVYENARIFGRNLAKTASYLVVGESTPGGTTTALAALLAMGISGKGMVSSSMAENPRTLKEEICDQALKSSHLEFGGCKDNPLKAFSKVGDPMMPAFTGLVQGAASQVPVLLAGGTQMAPIVAALCKLDAKVLSNIAVGTTRWIVEDKNSNLNGILSRVTDVPVLAAKVSFASSVHEGLRVYEQGLVKEGAGAGGMAVSAILNSKGKINSRNLLNKVEEIYSRILGK